MTDEKKVTPSRGRPKKETLIKGNHPKTPGEATVDLALADLKKENPRRIIEDFFEEDEPFDQAVNGVTSMPLPNPEEEFVESQLKTLHSRIDRLAQRVQELSIEVGNVTALKTQLENLLVQRTDLRQRVESLSRRVGYNRPIWND